METNPPSLWYMEKEEIIACVRVGGGRGLHFKSNCLHLSFDLLTGISDKCYALGLYIYINRELQKH